MSSAIPQYQTRTQQTPPSVNEDGEKVVLLVERVDKNGKQWYTDQRAYYIRADDTFVPIHGGKGMDAGPATKWKLYIEE